MGLGRPILHGLATMGITARVAAEAMSAHPADLSAATVRFSKPVYPGSRLRIDAETHQATARVEALVDGTITMTGAFRLLIGVPSHTDRQLRRTGLWRWHITGRVHRRRGKAPANQRASPGITGADPRQSTEVP